MKRTAFLLMLLAISILSFAQTTVKGSVADGTSKERLIGVTVYCPETKSGTTTDLDGSFTLKLPQGKHSITLSYVGYKPETLQVKTGDNLGTVYLNSESIGLNDFVVTSSIAVQRKTPVAVSVITPQDIQLNISTGGLPELLNSTPGVYATKSGGGFGDERVNIRGFSSENIAVMINGVPMNDMEWGGTYWSNWAGLSDVTRSLQVQRGLGASKIASPSVGGSINILTKSTEAKRGGSIFYGVANDGYQKMTFSASTGLSPQGWAVSMLGSKNTGNGYIQGTPFESYTAFLSVSKVINSNQTISFTGFMAPQWHQQRKDALTIQEWQLYGYKYNAGYGYDINGQPKTFNYNYYNKPQMSINHYWTINDKSSLSTVAYMSIGRGGGWSGLGANSSYSYGATNGIINNYYRKIDGSFDFATLENQNAVSASGSTLAIKDQTNDHMWYGLLSTFNTSIKHFDIQAGVDLRYYKGTHQGKVVDLLGGQFVIDPARATGKFKNDPNWVNQKLGLGDIVTRDYDGYVAQEGVFGQAEYNKDKLSAFVAGSVNGMNYWRVDRFYYNDVRSVTVTKYGFTGKGGLNYNLTKNHNVFANIGYFSRTPFFQGAIFPSYTTSNIVNKKAVNENVFSAELGYGFRSRSFSANLNVYNTVWKNKTMVKAVNSSDPSQGTINLTGVNSLRQGIELDIKWVPIEHLNITGMASYGNWKWDSNPTGYVYNVDGQPVDTKGNVVPALSPNQAYATLNLKGIHVGNSAQTTAYLSAQYELLRGFQVGVNYNYYARNYADFSLAINSWGVNSFAQPWRMPNAGVMNINANYRFNIGETKATLFGNINNLLNALYISDATDLNTTHDWQGVSVYYGFLETWSIGLKINF